MGKTKKKMVLPPWGVDQKVYTASSSANRAPNSSGRQMLARSMLQKQQQSAHSPQASSQTAHWRDKPYANHLIEARARKSAGSSMIAQKLLDRQRAGEITARATKSPNWERRKSDAFEYAESLDGQAEQQAGAVREAGKHLKQQLRVDIPVRGGSTSNNPPSPAHLNSSCSTRHLARHSYRMCTLVSHPR